MEKSREWVFEKAPVYKAYLSLTIPVVLGKVVMLVYNVVDTWFIATTGDQNLVAGVSLATPVFMLMIAIGDIFGIGGSSIISRLFGMHKNDGATHISSFCFYAALGSGVLLSVLLLAFQTPILTMLGADADTLPHALRYYQCIALGAPIIVASIVPVNLLRCEGMATASMIGGIVGSVVNILLDPIFIFTLGLGAAGAALATVIGNFCALCVYGYFYYRATWLTISLKACRITRKEAGQVFAIGIPASLSNLMQSFSVALTNRCLLPFGSDKIAALGIASKINMIANMLLVGFSFGAQPLIGYNYGNGNFARLKKILKFIYTFQISLAAILALALGFSAPVLIRFFMDDPAIIATGAQMLRFQLSGVMFIAIVLVSVCVFQSTGKATASLALAVSRQGIVLAVVLLLAYSVFGYIGVLAAQPIADFITAGIAAVLLLGGIGKELRIPQV